MSYDEVVAFERINRGSCPDGWVAVYSRAEGDGECGRWTARRGRTAEEILDDYPYLEREDIYAALEYAAAAVSERELPTPAT